MSVRKEAKAIASDYQKTFSTLHGKRVLFDLIKLCHMLRSSFVPGDSHHTAFNEGERSVVGKILTKMNMSPEKLDNLIKQNEENYARSRTNSVSTVYSHTDPNTE